MKNEVGRITLLREGKWWIAYYSSIDGRPLIEVARLLISIVDAKPEVKQAFMALTQLLVVIPIPAYASDKDIGQ